MDVNYLSGVIDTHVHSSPDVRPRKLSDLGLLKEAVRYNAAGIVIKSHHAPTAGRAALINELNEELYGNNGFVMYGGITLNSQVGGINPGAVETALLMGGRMVWLPTLEAEAAMKKEGKSGGVVCVRDGKVTAELKSVFALIRDHGAALATGHLSPTEIFIVVEAARNNGIQKIVINHPESHLVGLTLAEEKRLAEDYGAMMEHCYAQPVGGGVYKKNQEVNLEAIQVIGSSNMMIATDAGQTQNPYWYESLAESIRYLKKHGVSQEDIDIMTKGNPISILRQ